MKKKLIALSLVSLRFLPVHLRHRYCRADVGTDADAHCNAHPCGNACAHTKSAALRRTNSCADYGIL